MHITLTNLDPDRGRTIEIDIQGEQVSDVSGRILTAGQLNSHNTFADPDAVSPADFNGARVYGNKLSVNLPSKSIVVLSLR